MKYNPFMDYDRYGCLKPPRRLYWTLAFLLRSYLVWIAALSFRQDSTRMMDLFYPDNRVFFAAMLEASIALVVAVVVCLRRPGMPRFIQWLWRQSRRLLVVAVTIQLVLAISRFDVNPLHFSWWPPIELAILIVLWLFALRSRRLADSCAEFPEDVEKEK